MVSHEKMLPMLDYVNGLSGTLRETLASDGKGQKLPFDLAAARVLGLLKESTEKGGKIVFIGNGGSATIASHMVVDFNNAGLRAVSLNDPAMLTCLGNDFGYEQVFQKQIGFHGADMDTLIAISSSGNSDNILNGVSAAREKGMKVVTLSGFGNDNKLRPVGDYNFYVPSDRYGYVEIAHLTICHALADMAGDWRPD